LLSRPGCFAPPSRPAPHLCPSSSHPDHGMPIVRPRVRLEPVLSGGGQERGFRSGTLPHPLAAGFGAACEIAGREMVRFCRWHASRVHLRAGGCLPLLHHISSHNVSKPPIPPHHPLHISPGQAWPSHPMPCYDRSYHHHPPHPHPFHATATSPTAHAICSGAGHKAHHALVGEASPRYHGCHSTLRDEWQFGGALSRQSQHLLRFRRGRKPPDGSEGARVVIELVVG
jgi:hypothetical protein